MTGIKVIDLLVPFAKGGKVGLFGGAGVGKTVNMLELINNIAKQYSRPVGVRGRRRAHPRRQRLLPRDDRVGVIDKDNLAELQGGHGVRPDERAARQPSARGAHRIDHGGVLPRREAGLRQGPRRAVLRRQHLPLHARGHRGVGAARPHALGGGLPADARRGDGRAAGAHHLHQDRLDHLDPGGVRSRGRPDRSIARHDLRASGRHRRAVAPDRLARHLSGRGSPRFHQPPARPPGRRRGALRTRRAACRPVLQR